MLRLYYPCKPHFTNQRFGENANTFYAQLGMKGHNGEDHRALHGQDVRAAHDGTVTFAGEDGSGGYGVVVRTNELYDYNSTQVYFKSIYWHLLPGSFKVTAGQQVKVGDILAKADNTGMSTGDHLHFGLKPVLQGENEWQWFNVEQNNGYLGAIDPHPYWTGIHAEDYGPEVTRLMRIVEYLKGRLAELSKK